MPPERKHTTNALSPMQSTSVKKRNGTVTSWIWNHGEKVNNKDGTKSWRCSHCPKQTPSQYVLGGTSNQAHHLKNVHRITKNGKIPTNQTNIETSMNQPRGIDVKALCKVVIKWIIDRRHAFNEVAAESFRNMIAAIDKAAVNKLPHSGNTIRADILRYFKEAKPMIAELLSTARSRIHLSFDLYTSPNCKALLAITAHWTSAEYKAEATLLAIRELKEEHTGENIAQWIHIVVKEYGVMDKLGYFVMDNAGNNDTALVSLNRRIMEDGGEGFDLEARQLRCFAHTINLVVKELMFGKRKAPKQKSESPEDTNKTAKQRKQEERAQWRTLGALGKAHNICKEIQINPQHHNTYLIQ